MQRFAYTVQCMPALNSSPPHRLSHCTPVPGCPASSTARPAILPSLIMLSMTPAACQRMATAAQSTSPLSAMLELDVCVCCEDLGRDFLQAGQPVCTLAGNAALAATMMHMWQLHQYHGLDCAPLHLHVVCTVSHVLQLHWALQQDLCTGNPTQRTFLALLCPTMPCDTTRASSASSRPRPRMCEWAPMRSIRVRSRTSAFTLTPPAAMLLLLVPQQLRLLLVA